MEEDGGPQVGHELARREGEGGWWGKYWNACSSKKERRGNSKVVAFRYLFVFVKSDVSSAVATISFIAARRRREGG